MRVGTTASTLSDNQHSKSSRNGAKPNEPKSFLLADGGLFVSASPWLRYPSGPSRCAPQLLYSGLFLNQASDTGGAPEESLLWGGLLQTLICWEPAETDKWMLLSGDMRHERDREREGERQRPTHTHMQARHKRDARDPVEMCLTFISFCPIDICVLYLKAVHVLQSGWQHARCEPALVRNLECTLDHWPFHPTWHFLSCLFFF